MYNRIYVAKHKCNLHQPFAVFVIKLLSYTQRSIKKSNLLSSVVYNLMANVFGPSAFRTLMHLHTYVTYISYEPKRPKAFPLMHFLVSGMGKTISKMIYMQPPITELSSINPKSFSITFRRIFVFGQLIMRSKQKVPTTATNGSSQSSFNTCRSCQMAL